MRMPPRRVPKLVGDRVRLRALWWDGPLPRAGDMLETSTGRRYLIQQVGSTAPSFTLHCVVVPDDCALPPGHKLFRWTWTRKALRRPKGWKR
jgi:hypothetical protein